MDFIRRKASRLLLVATALITRERTEAAAAKQPNIVFIAIDDMNDWVGCLNGYSGKVHTPNIDALAEKGMLFTQAYCCSPMCNPSRTALWTGKRPSTTGVYGQYAQWDDNRTTVKTLFQLFKDNGYDLYGGGKIFHHGKEVHPDPAFNEILPFAHSGPPEKARKAGFLRYGKLHISEEEMPDYQLVSWCIDKLNQPHEKPFVIVPGLFRPHSPHWVPEKFFDFYPLEKIRVPEIPANEFDDIPEEGRKLANREHRYDPVQASGKIAEFIQAYLASITFADSQVGRMVKAVENSPYADNTIIVLWSDHGYHLGEKFHFAKSTLWEESARMPCIMYVPGITDGTNCTQPMDSIDIYPTLADLCGITLQTDIDGTSMVPLLKNPVIKWKPAVTMLQYKNVTVRSEDFRYIRYVDGSEELYDHRSDPGEHKNLAANPELKSEKEKLEKYIPENFVIDALPCPFHTGYIPPQIRDEFKRTLKERQNNWIPPETYQK